MTLYVCLDDKSGMLFNNRRQSRDARVLEDMNRHAQGQLMIDSFSRRLLERNGIPCQVIEQLPEDLSGVHFFLENRPAEELVPLAQQVILYRWNRHYPADTYFTPDLQELGFQLTQTLEFTGRSHEKITKEVYCR